MPTPRRVAFSGAEVIEFDAALAPVVRLCGAAGSPSADEAVTLECHARGLDGADCSARQQLTRQYVEELRRFLRVRGFGPISDDLEELQTQRRVVELLLAWAAGATDRRDKKNRSSEPAAADVLDPAALRRAQLAKKQLEGRVDDGYAFGRRFFSVATYVETLSREELLAVAEDRSMALPKLDEKRRAAVKALDRELLGLYGTAEGRPLRSLTLRQLVTEAEARGMLGPGGQKARDSKGKKSKRAWVDMLRPVLVAEVRAAKVMEKEEEMLREGLAQELEREKEQEQKQRVVELIEKVMERSTAGAAVAGGDCAEPEELDSPPLDQDSRECDKRSQEVGKARRYLEALVKTVCMPREGQEDVVMKE
ncbi:hypothetical protein PHYPSEUDO_012445 [Phytophthora pseudosyringae]|uniref:Uncharacterized protein n=1 Tax=Phytophthora pseudosyringae TaxID=221518 RepID=A0A8T1WN38_9STRA|nr:hypothetical protein PHYPSEUDO_012445 [Phytophthora pseudosyringae]